MHIHVLDLHFEVFIDLPGVGAQFIVDFHVAFIVNVAWVHLALNGAPRFFVYTAFSVALLMGACVEEPYAFKLESVAFEVLHFPFFTGKEASPELVFAFTACSAV